MKVFLTSSLRNALMHIVIKASVLWLGTSPLKGRSCNTCNCSGFLNFLLVPGFWKSCLLFSSKH